MKLDIVFMSYRNLEIWKLAKKQDREIHAMFLKLPRFELYERGSQIRKSAGSVGATIVEGYGRKRYKADFIKFLIYSLASNDETIYHLEMLHETGSLPDKDLFDCLLDQANAPGQYAQQFYISIGWRE